MESDQIKEMELGISLLEEALMSPVNPLKGKLWQAWHYLQVYSTWGLRLPSNQDDLKLYLKIKDPSTYMFFGTMLGAYEAIYNSSIDFQTNVFPRVIKLGSTLKEFAEDSRSSDDSIWTVIIELVQDKENYSDVLELITDLQTRAANNVREADEVAVLLGGYSAYLEIASGKLKAAGQSVEADQKTSTKTIKLLQSGPEVLGSIKQIQELADTQSEAYEANKVIAATTLTYAWVPIVGTIAAAVVAGVFGDKAVKALKAYKEAMKALIEEKAELETAIKAHEVQSLADVGITNSKKHTDLAIQNVTVVKNAWAALAGNLNVIKTKVENMTKSKDGEEVLKSKTVIKLYAKQSSKAWDKIWPSIKELTDDPYISIDSESKSIDQVINEIELAIAKPPELV